MLIIDSHVHAFTKGYFPKEWFDARANDWAARRWPLREASEIRNNIEAGMSDPNAAYLLADLAYAGIAKGVCIGLDPWLALSRDPRDAPSPRLNGQEVVQMQASILANAQDALVGFVGIDPRRPDALELTRWAITELGFQGVKLYPPHGYYPHDDICGPIFQLCLDHAAPVMVHTAAVKYPLLSRFCNPLHLQDVQHSFPGIRLIIAHAGYPMWWREAAVVAEGHPTTYLEVSNWGHEVSRNSGAVLKALNYWRDAVGAHRMLFGSDHFAGPGRHRREHLRRWVHFLQSFPFNPDEQELFFSGNISRLLGAGTSADDGEG